ncbi:GntR family transcriptional regulator [Staphylococcus equorum]|uniref:GntR family transcriptional regulator n=1 Tax=Staphylococcus equorum TaxID=246432 RepID=UPI0018AD17F8
MHGDWFYDIKIPSHRRLANQFNINRVTIIKSTELLESEGFIYTKKEGGHIRLFCTS